MSTDPERTLRHAADVTADDVWAVVEFLMPRLESLERIHGAGTEEHRTAAALAEAISVLVLNVIRLDAYWTGHDQHHTRSSRLEQLAYRLTA